MLMAFAKRRAMHATLLLAGCVVSTAQAADTVNTEVGLAFFETHIRPVLAGQCYDCHSVEHQKSKGGLLVDTREGLLAGGNSGPAIVPGDPRKSVLLTAISYVNEDTQMPPKRKLTDEQIADFQTWINMGAPDPRHAAPSATARQRLTVERAGQHWSLKPLVKPLAPAVKDATWPRSNIDQFILATLEKRDLHPVPDASRLALIRRATYDLIGLPPSPEEVAAFINDSAPTHEAFKSVVERLLASPHYGERWGRHWMDLVRYADTAGDNSDYPIPEAYLYRNYIIDSFNADKPYDRFVREQLAGDLMPYESWRQRNEQVVATGYIAMSRRFGSVVDRYPQHLTIDDTLDNMGKVFLGLSMGCARCHDHKFDPISKEDYYGLYGFFQSTRYPFPGIELLKIQKDFVPLIPASDVDALLAPHRAKERELSDTLRLLQEESAGAEKEKERLLQSSSGEKDAAGQITALEQRIIKLNDRKTRASHSLEEWKRSTPPIPSAYAVSESKPIDAHVNVRGEPDKPGDLVPRRFIEVLGGQTLSADAAKGSGRLQLADWITDSKNPLFARVMVNRIWKYHFGAGLSSTTSDFGSRGAAPTHPELLDWLAERFIASGYSVKQMHREIMLSRTYQLSSDDDAAARAVDAANTLYWRANRQRLDAEAVRDSILSVSGSLDAAPMTSPHPFPPPAKWNFTQHDPFKAVYPTSKRSVYVMTPRLNTVPFFATFDGADANATVANRDSSVTTIQALFWINDPFIVEQSRAFAARLVREAATDAERLDRAYRLVLGRPPSSNERELFVSSLQKVRAAMPPGGDRTRQEQLVWESAARAILRLNEFIYLD